MKSHSAFVENIQETIQVDQWPRYRIFGLNLASDFPFEDHLPAGDRAADLYFTLDASAPAPIDCHNTRPVFTSSVLTTQGQPGIVIYQQGDLHLMRYTDIADYLIRPGGIICRLLAPDQHDIAGLHILPAVLALWLELYRGIPSLHASAVAVNGSAVTFLGHKGHGKSTLVASFVQAGFPLLTDDLLPIEASEQNFYGRPAYPHLRLWPDQVDHFPGIEGELELIQPGYPKRRAILDENDALEFSQQSRPLESIYCLERRAPQAGETHIEFLPLSPREAALELIRFAWAPRASAALGFSAARLAFFARLAKQVPVRRLVYPHGFAHLVQVRQAIHADLHRGSQDQGAV